MAKIKIIHEFDYHEERSELKNLVLSQDAIDILDEIDQDIRSKLKYSQEQWLVKEARYFLEEIRNKILSSGTLNRY